MKKEFRVWCHRTKSWLHNEVTSTHVWSDYSIDIFNGKLCEYVTNDGKHFHKHKDDSEFTIHLWTGLYDKNGKKIFEGDILEIYGHVLYESVSYQAEGHSGFGFWKHDNSTRDNGTFESLGEWTSADGYRVVGNIMENKNILTE